MSRKIESAVDGQVGVAHAVFAPMESDIRAIVDATDAGMIGARDRAICCSDSLVRSGEPELVGLDIADCAFRKVGLTVTLRKSKTDQDGAGRKIGIPYGSNPETCPVRNCQTRHVAIGLQNFSRAELVSRL
jgi:hypothetical protein